MGISSVMAYPLGFGSSVRNPVGTKRAWVEGQRQARQAVMDHAGSLLKRAVVIGLGARHVGAEAGEKRAEQVVVNAGDRSGGGRRAWTWAWCSGRGRGRVGVLALTEFLTLMKLSTSMTLPCRLLPARLGCWGCCCGCWGAAMGTG